MNYLVSVVYAARLHAVEQLWSWERVKWESEFINPSSLPLLYLIPLFPHSYLYTYFSLDLWIIVLTLTLPISVSWKSEQVSKMHKAQTDTECKTILRNIYSIRSQAEDVLYVSAKGEASPKGLKCNGFHRTQFVWYEMILCRHKVAPIRSQAD